MPAPTSHPCVRRALRWVALALALAFSLTASPSAGAEAPQGRTLQLEVFINDTSRELVIGFTELSDGRLASTRKELHAAGIKAPGTGNDDDVIVLSDLEGLVYRYDEPRQRIDLVVSNELRVPHEIDARGQGPPMDPVQAGYGAVLNYTLYASSVKEVDEPIFAFSGVSSQLDARLFSPFGYMQQTAIVGATALREVDALRLETSLVYSNEETAITYRAGDAISRGPLWARPIRFGGLQIERNFGLRPDLVTAPLPSLTGTAAVPSTVEVLVNNFRTFSRDIPAGPYSITNLPVLSGAGSARVVLRDASGRSVETSLPFFTSPQLLRQGLVDYSLQGGFPRLRYALESNEYSEQPVGMASVRYGLSDSVTLEAHGEGGAGLYNAGAGLVTNAGALGILAVAGRASHYEGATGFQAYATFETRLLGFNLNLSTQRTFGEFEDLASATARLRPDESDLARLFREVRDPTFVEPLTTGSITKNVRPPRAIDRISIGMPLPIVDASVGVSLINLERADGIHSQLVAASYSQTIAKTAVLSVNAFADLRKRNDAGIFIGLSMPLGESAQASVGGVSNANGVYATAEVAKSLGAEPGSYGWRTRAVQGKTESYRTAAASYRSEYGRAEIAGEQFGRGGRVTAEFDGAIATTGSGVFLANRVDDAFAVVDVGVPDMEVFHENRSVGRTGASGRILVPNLRSHQRNRITVDGSGLPVDAHMETTDEFVVPAQKAGVRVDFGVRAHDNSALLILHNGNGEPLQAGLHGRIDGKQETFIVGYDGRAFLRQLNAANSIVIELPSGECRATFDYVPRPGEQVVIGPVPCL